MEFAYIEVWVGNLHNYPYTMRKINVYLRQIISFRYLTYEKIHQ